MLSRATPQITVFLGIFIISFYLQHTAWTMRSGVIDEWLWGRAVTKASQELLYQPATKTEFESGAYGYPGATLILPSALLVRAGLTPLRAMQDVISFSIAFGIAAVAWACFRLRPMSLWWAGATLLLLFNDLYFIATPASSMVMLWTAFLVLCVIYIFEHKTEPSTGTLVVLGVASGYAVATRFDIAILISTSVLVFLVVTFRKIPWIFFISCSAALLFFDPYLLAAPVKHLLTFMYKTADAEGSHITLSVGKNLAPSLSIVIFEAAPPAVLAFIGALASLWRTQFLPFSRTLVLWLLATTIFICCLLFLLPSLAQWYFFPIFILWEVFLPLSIWTFFDALKDLSHFSRILYTAIFFGGILSAHLFLFFNIMLV